MNIFQKLIVRAFTKALKENPQYNELNQLLYGHNQYGVYQQADNEDDPVDLGFNINTTVWAIVNRVSRAAAKVPLCVQKWNGEAWEKVDDHELYEVLDSPNERQGKTEFFQEAYAMKLVFGNEYIYSPIPENGMFRGKVTHLYNAPANKIEIVPGGDFMSPIKGYRVDESFYGGNSIIPKERILHLKNLNLDYDNGSEFYGKSALQVGIEVLKKDKAREVRMYKNYENSGANGMVYREGDGIQRLTPTQQQTLNREIQKNIRNAKGTITVLQEKYGYIPLGITPADMQIIEDAKWSLKDICNLYNVPSVLFGDSDNSKYNNVKEAKKDLYLNAAIPEVESLCDEFNRQWMSAYGKEYRLWYDDSQIEELQSDKLELVEWSSKSGVMTINERRALLDLEPLEGEEGEIILSQTGQMPLEMLSAANALQALTMGEQRAQESGT